jgi:signal transduction histidine kinase
MSGITALNIAIVGASMLSMLLVVVLVNQRNKRVLLQQQNAQERNEHAQQNELLKAIISTQELERNRIAADLHDSVGAELSMLTLNLSKFAFYLKQKKVDSEPLNKELENLDETIEHIRSICRDLYPVTLQSYGFIRTFEELVTKINSRSSITCKYKINLKETDLFPNLDSKLNLLRLFQEVINNIIKYAKCTHVDIGFMKYESSIKIILKHNGVAFDNKNMREMLTLGRGVGLASINNRINLLKGKITYSKVTNGSEILIELPISNDTTN